MEKHGIDKHIIDFFGQRINARLQIRIGRSVRCCVPGVARPRGRGRSSRKVSPGLKRRELDDQ